MGESAIPVHPEEPVTVRARAVAVRSPPEC